MRFFQSLGLPGLWVTTSWNKWGVEVEQCHPSLGYRNRTFDDNLHPRPWVPGPHPIAQGLRDAGKQETPGYKTRA